MEKEQYWELAKAETGTEDNPKVAQYTPQWLTMSSAVSSNHTRFLLLKARILRYLMGDLRTRIDVTQGRDRQSLRQQFLNVSEMLKEVQSEIGQTDPVVGSTIAAIESHTPASYLAGTDEDVAYGPYPSKNSYEPV